MRAVRSTPPWQSQDLAEATSRAGTRAPCRRANSPTAIGRSASQGKRVAPAGSSCGPGRYRNDGNVGRGWVSPSATSCGTSKAITRGDFALSLARRGVDVGHRRVGGSEIDPDQVARGLAPVRMELRLHGATSVVAAAGRSRTSYSSFQRRLSSRLTHQSSRIPISVTRLSSLTGTAIPERPGPAPAHRRPGPRAWPPPAPAPRARPSPSSRPPRPADPICRLVEARNRKSGRLADDERRTPIRGRGLAPLFHAERDDAQGLERGRHPGHGGHRRLDPDVVGARGAAADPDAIARAARGRSRPHLGPPRGRDRCRSGARARAGRAQSERTLDHARAASSGALKTPPLRSTAVGRRLRPSLRRFRVRARNCARWRVMAGSAAYGRSDLAAGRRDGAASRPIGRAHAREEAVGQEPLDSARARARS